MTLKSQQETDKPNSVFNAVIYLAWNVAAQVLAVYPKGQRATSTLSYSTLLRVRFVKPADYPTAGALLPHLSTFAEKNFGSLRFYDTIFKITLTGRYPARRSVEFGLSSNKNLSATASVSCQLCRVYHNKKKLSRIR